MSNSKLAGFLVLGSGAVLGIFLGGQTGLGLVTVTLVLGFGLWFAPEARGISGPSAAPKPRILVLLKHVHLRPQKNGKFHGIEEQHDSGLDFEVFLNCWLLNESDLPAPITEGVQLTLKSPDGSLKPAERIRGDLDNWRLGSLVRDEWDTDVVHPHQEEMPELSIEKPLDCGVPREGWLHFRFANVSASELRKGELRLSLKDVFSNIHEGVATGSVRHLPGRVWPYAGKSASATHSGN
jgi:hypothetical protein